MALTRHLDLRGGRSCWRPQDHTATTSDPLPASPVDVAIVGAGVAGAMLADRLTSDGHTVALVDRRPPAHGATAASTALVMWAADVPLSHLAQDLGAKEAARRWRRVHRAVLDLSRALTETPLDCGWAPCPELYLAGDLLDAAGLAREVAGRKAAGLPSRLLRPDHVQARFKLAPRAALLSADAFEVDPVALTLGLLARARARGATATFPSDVVRINLRRDAIDLHTADGRAVIARQVVLAAGYEAAGVLLPEAFTLGASFAIATAPGSPMPWAERAMIWQASTPYLYARSTADGRLIFGGADEDIVDAAARDRRLTVKAAALQAGAAELTAAPPPVVDCAWAATFGASPDGLPAIGRTRDDPRVWFASGFGGNGVTFARLAADLIAVDLAGAPDPDAAAFDPYRFESSSS